MKRKWLKTVIEELKQSMRANCTKVRRYQQRNEQFRQNRIFYFDQKKMYAEFNRNEVRLSDVPNAKESRRLLGVIWSAGKGHNQEAEWLKYIKNELGNNKYLPEGVAISVEKVTKQCRKVSNWKAPGKDVVQGYLIKNLSNLHERIAVQTNKILMGDDSLPARMAHGRTVLCQKDPKIGNPVENYRLTTCLPLMKKCMIILKKRNSCQKKKEIQMMKSCNLLIRLY